MKQTTEGLPFRLGIDVGGTFTDLTVTDSNAGPGELRIHKALTTPSDPSIGVFEVLGAAASDMGMNVRDLLSRTGFLGLGTTVATNIMVEGRGAKVALVTTEGFRDSLAIRRGIRQDVWDIARPHPPELVPRWLRLPLRERIGRAGEVLIAPAQDDIDALVAHLAQAEVEAVAICLYNSFLNGAHERLVARAVSERLPDVFLSVSADLAPVVGEYERSSTTVVNAFVGPKTKHYLKHLTRALAENGLACEPLMMQSNGGLVNVEMLSDAPVRAVLSGPAAGAASAVNWAATSGRENVVFFDMGGTSIDILIAQDGRAGNKSITDIEGYHMAVPSVDIRTIGTGGGTIARIDAGGLLRVGPDSAGSTPGPVCYGKGGALPTVTDCNLVLGRLGADTFRNGDMTLDTDAARRAIADGLAGSLSASAEQAALSVVTVANENMANSLTVLAAESGIDLRDFILIAAGGAAGLHVSAVSQKLGMAGVYVPRQASVACSVGMVQSDVMQDQVISVVRPLAAVDAPTLQTRADEIVARVSADLARTGLGKDVQHAEVIAELRYIGQVFSIPVKVEMPLTRASLDKAGTAFHLLHEEYYHHQHPDNPLELVNLQINVIGTLDKLVWKARSGVERPTPAPYTRRPVWFDWSDQPVDTGVWRGEDLAPGDRIAGPAVIVEPTTSILLDRDDTARVDDYGNYMIHHGVGGQP